MQKPIGGWLELIALAAGILSAIWVFAEALAQKAIKGDLQGLSVIIAVLISVILFCRFLVYIASLIQKRREREQKEQAEREEKKRQDQERREESLKWTPQQNRFELVSEQQVAHLERPETMIRAQNAYLTIQERLVALGDLRECHNSIFDDRFRRVCVVKPLLNTFKQEADAITRADVAVLVKLFPKQAVEGLLKDGDQFDVFEELLVPYAECPAEGLSHKNPCRTPYRLVPGPSGEATHLENYIRHLRPHPPEPFYVSSALNEVFQRSQPIWIGNGLEIDPNPAQRNYFTDSHYFLEGHFKSQALFVLTRRFDTVSPINLPIGVLIFETTETDRFDSEVFYRFGKYCSNRFYYFLKHAIKAPIMRDRSTNGEFIRAEI
jgi:uncharacterized membrane protein